MSQQSFARSAFHRRLPKHSRLARSSIPSRFSLSPSPTRSPGSTYWRSRPPAQARPWCSRSRSSSARRLPTGGRARSCSSRRASWRAGDRGHRDHRTREVPPRRLGLRGVPLGRQAAEARKGRTSSQRLPGGSRIWPSARWSTSRRSTSSSWTRPTDARSGFKPQATASSADSPRTAR